MLQAQPSFFRPVVLKQAIAGFDEDCFAAACLNQPAGRHAQYERDEPGMAQQRKKAEKKRPKEQSRRPADGFGDLGNNCFLKTAEYVQRSQHL